jgi:hypothetical protein
MKKEIVIDILVHVEQYENGEHYSDYKMKIDQITNPNGIFDLCYDGYSRFNLAIAWEYQAMIELSAWDRELYFKLDDIIKNFKYGGDVLYQVTVDKNFNISDVDKPENKVPVYFTFRFINKSHKYELENAVARFLNNLRGE